jgi:hypothetical protein
VSRWPRPLDCKFVADVRPDSRPGSPRPVGETIIDGAVPVGSADEPDRDGLSAAFVLVTVALAILLSAVVTLALLASLQPT